MSESFAYRRCSFAAAAGLPGGGAVAFCPARCRHRPSNRRRRRRRSPPQQQAQQAIVRQAPAAPTLKRKIALGRITNETNYGRSLLRDRHDDPLGWQVTDLMSKSLTESGAYLVFERPTSPASSPRAA